MSSIPGYPTPSQDHRVDELRGPAGAEDNPNELTLEGDEVPPGLPPLGLPLAPAVEEADGE